MSTRLHNYTFVWAPVLLRWLSKCPRVVLAVVFLVGWFGCADLGSAQTNLPPESEQAEDRRLFSNTNDVVSGVEGLQPNPAFETNLPSPPDSTEADPAQPADAPKATEEAAEKREPAVAAPSLPADNPTNAPPSKTESSPDRAPARDADGKTTEAGTASEPQSAAPPDFAAFRLISDRNIFDPNRAPRRAGTTRPKPKTIDRFTLVGIMSYEKGTFAFFDGSSSEYRKVLKNGDSAGGFKVTGIGDQLVTVSHGQTNYTLKIGSQLRREDEGEWIQSKDPQPALVSSPGASAKASSPASNSEVDDEVLKRLMQRREKE